MVLPGKKDKNRLMLKLSYSMNQRGTGVFARQIDLILKKGGKGF